MSKHSSGRRIRVEPRRTSAVGSALRGRTAPLALLVLVLAGGLLGVTALRSPDAQSDVASTGEALVSSVAMSCPSFTDGKKRVTDQSVATTSLDVASAPTSGSRRATPLPGRTAVAALSGEESGRWLAAKSVAGAWKAVLLQATGGAAPGAVAYTSATAGKDLGAGLAISSCPRPARESWFVGAGSSAEHQTALVLTNTTSAAAVVSVRLDGSKGAVETVGANPIAVAPGAVRVVPVEDLAAGESELAIRAVVERGSVAVSAVDVSRTGTTASGSEWIPATAAPSRRQTVAGVSSGDITRTLLVANPGDRTATAGISIAGEKGRFTPKGLEKVVVKPHSVRSVDVGPRIATSDLAVELASDEPVTAAVRVRSAGRDPDTAYAVADTSTRGTSVVPIAVSGTDSGRATSMILTNGGAADASVTVAGRDTTGKARGSIDVTVPAGRTVAVDPSKKGSFDVGVGELAYLTVDPGGRPIFAAATYKTSDGISVLPLRIAPSRLPAPVAVPGT